MVQRKTIKALYPDSRDEVIDYMLKVYKFLESRYSEIKDEWKAVLTLLNDDLELFYQCKDKIKADGIMIKDRYGNFNKHPLFPILNNLQIQVLKCIGELGLSPKSSSKIKEGATDDEVEETVSDFLSGLVG